MLFVAESSIFNQWLGHTDLVTDSHYLGIPSSDGNDITKVTECVKPLYLLLPLGECNRNFLFRAVIPRCSTKLGLPDLRS